MMTKKSILETGIEKSATRMKGAGINLETCQRVPYLSTEHLALVTSHMFPELRNYLQVHNFDGLDIEV